MNRVEIDEHLKSCPDEHTKAAFIFYLQLKNKVTLEWTGGHVKAHIDSLELSSPKFYPETKVIDAIIDIVSQKGRRV